jgi:hypothetical protein
MTDYYLADFHWRVFDTSPGGIRLDCNFRYAGRSSGYLRGTLVGFRLPEFVGPFRFEDDQVMGGRRATTRPTSWRKTKGWTS